MTPGFSDDGSPVLNPSEVNVTTLSGAAQGQAPGGAPAKNVPQSFVSCDVKVSQHGTAQNFWVWVAVYQTGSDGETQNLLGYVKWDPTVVCQ
jgi:nematocidal protein AidA